MSSRLTLTQAKKLGLIPKDEAINPKLSGMRQRQGAMPQDILLAACQDHWPGCVPEFTGAVPGRKFRLDIAFPERKIYVECDGWSHHGKHKAGFQRDRDRQNLLTINGWRVLRFSAGDIFKRLPYCLDIIEQVIG